MTHNKVLWVFGYSNENFVEDKAAADESLIEQIAQACYAKQFFIINVYTRKLLAEKKLTKFLDFYYICHIL